MAADDATAEPSLVEFRRAGRRAGLLRAVVRPDRCKDPTGMLDVEWDALGVTESGAAVEGRGRSPATALLDLVKKAIERLHRHEGARRRCSPTAAA